MSIEETDAIFARAYASAIVKKFIPGGINKDNQVVFLSPLVQRGIAGGDLIPEPVTNYMTYKVADAVLSADDPSYIGVGKASYIQSLRSYADHIDTKTDRSPAVVSRMEQARRAVDIADAAYIRVEDEAWDRWNVVKDRFPGLDFYEWAGENYPALSSARERRNAAYNELDSAAQLFDGPQASALLAIRNKIRDAQERTSIRPGLNQIAVAGDVDRLQEALDRANGGLPVDPAKLETLRVPVYSIQGYLITLREWIRRGAVANPERTEVVDIDVSDGMTTKWEDYGYKKVTGSGRIGIFPFFSVTVKHESEEETYHMDTKSKENKIALSISAIGFQMLNITAGEWDVPGIKLQFPSLLPGSPDALSPNLARISSILVGYDVALKVTFDSSIREEAKRMYESAKSTGGSMTIFGFHVSATPGGSYEEQVKTDFQQTTWDESSGSLTLTPASKQVYPTLLAVLGQRL